MMVASQISRNERKRSRQANAYSRAANYKADPRHWQVFCGVHQAETFVTKDGVNAYCSALYRSGAAVFRRGPRAISLARVEDNRSGSPITVFLSLPNAAEAAAKGLPGTKLIPTAAEFVDGAIVPIYQEPKFGNDATPEYPDKGSDESLRAKRN
jgi:hypothetical protein